MSVPGSLRDIVPGDTDRVLFVGQTGSGKTTLAQYLAATRVYFVGLFPKGIDSARGWTGTRVRTLDALTKLDVRKHPHIIYAPDPYELSDPETIDLFFQWVYERRNCTLYIDELYAVTSATVYPFHLGACYTRGRERRVETWGATQRPARVPQIVSTEAEHVYCFRLRAPQDRERVEDLAGIPADAIARLPKHQFIYAPQDGEVSGALMLRLPAAGYRPRQSA